MLLKTIRNNTSFRKKWKQKTVHYLSFHAIKHISLNVLHLKLSST